MKNIIFFVLVFLNLNATAQMLSKNQSTQVDSLFAEWDKTNSPGCILGVIKDGKFIYQRGYGMANIELGTAISPYTVFDIGSISKQFTATSIILLKQQGKLSLDDTIRKYIPELPYYGKSITIRQLLNHTSGLRDYNTLLFLAGKQWEQVTTKQDALSIIMSQNALNFNPGDKWDYSNSGYFLASVIVERISGQTMKAFAEQYIFGPLGMKNTFYLDNHKTIVPYRATGYAPSETSGFQINMSDWEQTGDGAVQTNCNDLLLWDNNFYDPRVGGQDLLKDLTTFGALNNGEKITYTLGLFIEDFQGMELIQHSGAWAGYRSQLLRFPQEKFSVICLSNLASFDPTGLAKEVAKIYLSDKLKPKTETDNKQKKLTVKPIEQYILRSYIGYYRSEFNDFTRQIQLEKDKLFIVRTPSNKGELIYQGNDEFIMKDYGFIVKFIRDNKNIVSALNINRGGEKPDHLTRYTPVKFTKIELSGISGNYFSKELNATYKLEACDSMLLITLPNNHETYSLTAITRDSFTSFKGLSIELIYGKNKKVNGFYLSYGGIRKINFKRL
jgi:CubicO group peptidase (beta-lactamase class C family)